MKKLITAIAAIATSFGLFAADFAHSVTNDICFKTNNLVVGYNAMGDATVNESDSVIVNWFADSLKTNFTDKIGGYEQPELKDSDTDPSYKFLAIDTDVKDPVLRTFSPVTYDTGAGNYKYDPVDISAHGVFIDTETTFTLFDTVPESPSDSKILVWARETEADEDAGIAGATNLMVTCGVEIDKKFLPTNYVLAVDGIVPEQMYRLTIRADKEKDSENTIFRVYLDGEQLKTVPLEDGTTLEVFPSLVGGNQQLGAAGFGGTGSLKGIDLLTQDDAPAQVPFAIDPTYLTVTWNEGVASFTVAQDDCDDQVIEVTGSGETNLVVKAGAATVTPTFVTEPQYKLQDFLNEDETLNLEYEGNVASIDIPLYADASTLAIIAVQDREGAELWVTLTDEEQPIKIGAARPHVKDAIAALSELTPEQVEKGVDVVKIVLLMDEQNTDFGDWSLIDASSGIILDLNGHTMEAIEPWNPDDEFRAMINNANGVLTVMDSSGDGGGMIKGIVGADLAHSVMPILNGGGLTIEKAIGTAECKFYGTIFNLDMNEATIDIYGGLFSDITYLEPSDLVTLPDGKEWSADTIDGYYYLTEPGAVTLSLTKGAHNSISSSPAAGSIEPGAEVTVTVTPDEGYQFASTPDGWDAGASGTIVSNFTITADTAIIAPDATAIEYALTLTGNDTVTITSDQSDNTQIPYDTQVKVTVEPKTDYEFAADSYEGWEKEGANLVSNFVMKGETTITAPTATAIEYSITWAESENVVATNNGVQVESGITLAKDATITFYPTVGSITNIVVDGEAVAVSSPYTFTVKAQASVLKVLAGVTAAPEPTPVDPTEGTITKDDNGNFVINPEKDGAEITVQNAGNNNFIVESDVDFTIKGVAADKIKVMCNGEDITSVCKGGDAEGFSTELDPAKTTPELIEATATEQPLVVGTTVDLKIKASVPGLAYKLLRVGEVGDFSDSTKITTATTVKGTGDELTLKDSNKPANKAFYKVAVGKDVINESAD